MKKIITICLLILIVSLFGVSPVKAQIPLLSISFSVGNLAGAGIPNVEDTVFLLDLASTQGDVTINSLTFTEVGKAGTATDYKLYYKVAGANDYQLIAEGVSPVNGAVIFNNFNLTIVTGSLDKIKIVANTTNTISAYRIDLTNVALGPGQLITSLPLNGPIRFYSDALTQHELLPQLTASLASSSPSGTVQPSNSSEVLRINLSCDQALTITSLTFEQFVQSGTATNYRVDAGMSTIASNLTPYNNKIILTNLNLNLSAGVPTMLFIYANTTNLQNTYHLKLTSIAARQSNETKGLTVLGNDLAFSLDLNGSLSGLSPYGAALKSTSESIIKVNLGPAGSDLTLDKLFFTESNMNAGITDFKLYSIDSQNPIATATVGDFVKFENLNITLKNFLTQTFEVRANTTQASGNYSLTLFGVNTFPVASTIGHGFPINGNTLIFPANVAISSDLTFSLNSDSPAGSGIKSSAASIMKFNLSVASNDVIINEFNIWETKTGSAATNYQLIDINSGIVLAYGVNVSQITYKFTGFDLRIPKNTTRTLEIKANTINTNGIYELKLTNILAAGQINFHETLPLASNLLDFSGVVATSPTSPTTPIATTPTTTPTTTAPTATTPTPTSAVTNFVQAEKALVTKADTSLVNRLNGYILLQVQNAGQAWYVEPNSDLKYYLPDGSAAYSALRKFGLGITNADLAKIPVGIESRFQDIDTDGDGLPDKLEEGLGTNPAKSDSDGDGYSDLTEIQTGYNPLGSGKLNIDTALANRLKGRIVLQVQSKGEAWYINPKDGKRYYMKDGGAAYQIMRYLSLGITNSDLRTIPVGNL